MAVIPNSKSVEGCQKLHFHPIGQVLPGAVHEKLDLSPHSRHEGIRGAVACLRPAPLGPDPAGRDVRALVAFGTWLLLTFFGGLITQSDRRVPRAGDGHDRAAGPEPVGPADDHPAPAGHAVPRGVAGDPEPAGRGGVSNPATIGGYEQAAQRIPSLQSFEQSILLVWPHMVTMVALAVLCFAIAYVRFMRQEVRA